MKHSIHTSQRLARALALRRNLDPQKQINISAITIGCSFEEAWNNSMNEKLDESSRHKLTKWYYLFPILLGIFGGILGYFWLLDVDKTKAENLGYVGYFLTILYFVIYISIFPLHA